MSAPPLVSCPSSSSPAAAEAAGSAVGSALAADPRGSNLSDEEAQHILRSYNLRLRGLRRIHRGTINSNYWVDTDAGPLFLRINEGKTEADARFEAELIWHLGSRGFLTPQLWRTRASEPYMMWRRSPHDAAQPVMLMTWVNGHELTEHELTDGHAHIAGVLLGQLHLCTAGFAHTRPGIYTMARIRGRLERLQRDPRAIAEVGPLVTELQDELQGLAAVRRRDLPGGIGHGDLFPDNLLFARRDVGASGKHSDKPVPLDQLGWVLDLEQAAALPYVYDVAVALLAFCAPVAAPFALSDVPRAVLPAEPPGGPADAKNPPPADAPDSGPPTLGPLHRSRARALLAGYQTMRVLGEAEWRALLAELRWAAVRFTTTRLTDVAHYGQPLRPAAPPPRAEDRRPTPTPTPEPGPNRPEGPRHSKDYRDFARRLTELRALTQDDMDAALR